MLNLRGLGNHDGESGGLDRITCTTPSWFPMVLQPAACSPHGGGGGERGVSGNCVLLLVKAAAAVSSCRCSHTGIASMSCRSSKYRRPGDAKET